MDLSPPEGVHLTRTEENVAEIEGLAQLFANLAGGGRVGIEGLVRDLNRRAGRTWAPGLAVHRALSWDAYDQHDTVWWPQGVTTSEDTGASRDLLAVAWYAKDGQGARVTFLDLERRRYRHVLLVTPVFGTHGVAGVRPVRVHAGGLVWHGPYLHVAATGRGFLTFRLADLMRVPDRSELAVHGYRYVLPLRFAYRAAADEGHPGLRYSFLSLDRSGEAPALLVGEYGSRKQTRRLAHFPVDPSTGLLEVGEDGLSRPLTGSADGVVRTQGAVVARGTYYLTASQGPWKPGTMYVGRPGSFRAHRWATPMGPEDLVWWRSTDLLWSVSEHPRRRWAFAMRRAWFG